jgi:hydroxymethylpyrimidine pyrophosphatase-like HAD family hydrolase
LCGLTGQQVTAIGDHPNDLPVFDVATTAVAPANALADVLLARADIVMAANDVDGVVDHLLTQVAPSLPGRI